MRLKKRRNKRRSPDAPPLRRARVAQAFMMNDTLNSAALQSLGAGAAPVGGPLPVDLVLSERAAAALRSYLIANGLSEYRVFYCREHDLFDIDDCLEGLGES